MVNAESWLSSESPAIEACDTPTRVSARRSRIARLDRAGSDLTVLEDLVPQLVRSIGRSAVETHIERFHFSDRTVRNFTLAVLEVDEDVATRFIADLRAAGASVESLYLGLFSESARLLGKYWETDRCPFAEVTLGLWRLHRLVHDMGPDFRDEQPRETRFLQAILTTAPGEDHSFGLVLVSEWFRRAGWNILSSPLDTTKDIARAVSADFLAIVGFSASADTNLERLSASIAVVRRKSRNPAVGVMVGGALFIEHPELVAQVGADATAADAAEALAKAQRFVVSGKWGPH